MKGMGEAEYRDNSNDECYLGQYLGRYQVNGQLVVGVRGVHLVLVDRAVVHGAVLGQQTAGGWRGGVLGQCRQGFPCVGYTYGLPCVGMMGADIGRQRRV